VPSGRAGGSRKAAARPGESPRTAASPIHGPLAASVPIAANLSVSADFPVDAVNHDEDVEDELADAA